MHGRVKVRTSEEQAEAKRLEQAEKLKVYTSITGKLFSKRENEEYNEESLTLSGRLLEKNPDFYTLWNYRREVLLKLKETKSEDELKKLCLEELDLTQNCLRVNPKSYSTWHHRFWCMEFNPEGDWKRELKLCNFFLSQDERNFHCWDYRRIVCKKCNVSAEEELDYSTSLIETNFSNYSAWHYRSTLLPIVHLDPETKSVKEEVLLKEFELIQNAAFTDPEDQSVWFYHRWLLGRSKSSPKILCMSLLESLKSILVLFSDPVKCDELELQVNGIESPSIWMSFDDSSASTLWVCEVPCVFFHDDRPADLHLALVYHNRKERTSQCMSIIGNQGKKARSWKHTSRVGMFRSELSAATKDVLERELESCLQLNELEPNCKWTLFTSVLLMRALKDSKYQEDIVNYMEQLCEVDKLRRNYYKDLSSKFAVEDIIENLPNSATIVDFSSQKLTSLYHFDHLFLIEEINLSDNFLTSVYPLRFLVCVKKINLDNNQLTTVEGIEDLDSLEHLSLKNNCLTKTSNLEVLHGSSRLKEIFLKGNPVTDDTGYLTQCLKKIKWLRSSDCSEL